MPFVSHFKQQRKYNINGRIKTKTAALKAGIYLKWDRWPVYVWSNEPFFSRFFISTLIHISGNYNLKQTLAN